MSSFRILIFLMIIGNFGGCGSRQFNFTQQGKASYYSAEFEGRLTANGETFDPDNITAAHMFLPFGTRVKVINAENGKSVFVRVNDRGPYAENRIMDLSPRAAEKLSMLEKGVSPVIIKANLPPDVADSLEVLMPEKSD